MINSFIRTKICNWNKLKYLSLFHPTSVLNNSCAHLQIWNRKEYVCAKHDNDYMDCYFIICNWIKWMLFFLTSVSPDSCCQGTVLHLYRRSQVEIDFYQRALDCSILFFLRDSQIHYYLEEYVTKFGFWMSFGGYHKGQRRGT